MARAWTHVLLLAGARCALLDSLLASHNTGGGPTVSIPAANLSLALGSNRGPDVAVFYYSPYGEAGSYSRQVLPLWDEVAKWHASRRTKRLTVAKFSCEASAEHRRVCAAAGVRQYPTITYYAHDKLRFGPLFGARRSAPPLRSVNYRGIALYEALRDWTVALHGVSEAQRLGDRVKQLLGWQKSPRDLEVEELRAALRAHEAAAFDRNLEVNMARLRGELADKPVEPKRAAAAASAWEDLVESMRSEPPAEAAKTTTTAAAATAAAPDAAAAPKTAA